jgi:hypothetical protein
MTYENAEYEGAMERRKHFVILQQQLIKYFLDNYKPRGVDNYKVYLFYYPAAMPNRELESKLRN